MSLLLIVGATGSVGHHVVNEALREGYQVRVLLRQHSEANFLNSEVERIIGDLENLESLYPAVNEVDAIIFTHGSHGFNKEDFENIDFGGVKNILLALNGRPVHMVLMTAIGVTVRSTMHDWKRRAERLIRSSGNPYTIVRPGWFDYNNKDELKLVALQGDNRRNGNPQDGAVSRRQIAQVLVKSLSVNEALNKTFELISEKGTETKDFITFFQNIEKDTGGLDAIHDRDNMPVSAEPTSITSLMTFSS